ncbi:beta-ketoacyl synthase N-terminal-like domain-containing protein [Pseudomaricurvus sp.]|uniref:beta-ketoacyl synthase N-terminal-like domain-containing protein n=1 Tax=Pseudomaricurvus sp. TaxID=2004510 RepID=UPI003F6A6B44
MTVKAGIAGSGIVSTLGEGLATNLDALNTGQGRFALQSLEGFNEPVEAAFLSAGNSSDQDAIKHFQSLLDRALEEAFANSEISSAKRKTLPIFIGSSSYGIGIGEAIYRQALENEDQSGTPAQPLPLDGFTLISKHLRKKYQLNGPDFTFNTACTAGANALLSAVDSITQGHHEYALVIGLETFNVTTLSGFYGMQLLTHEAMKPFDIDRSGLVLGEGCACILLKATTTENNGIIVSGGASGCDSHSISASNPDGSSIAAVMQEALNTCQLQPEDIIAVKAHGTASPLNDDGEAAGMRRTFTKVPPFFSLKSYIGHTLGSCGVLETVLMAGCLRQRQLPASAGFTDSDPTLDVIPSRQPQSAPTGHYMLNFFGFGGNNCSLILRSGASI